MTLRIGAHVDQLDPIGDAREMGADLVQIVIGSPQSWKAPQLDHPDGLKGLCEQARGADLHLYVHSPFVINVASTNNRIRIPSRKLLQQTINAAAELGAKGVVVHGGHVTADEDPAVGFDNWRKCVERLELPVPLLIENTAGGTRAMARGLERLKMLWEAISSAPQLDSIGFCLDTCHAFAGGDELAGLVERITAITGRIDLIHCNDSKGGFNSGLDRHANLGQGQIEQEDLVQLLARANAPIVLETPGGSTEHAQEISWLREQLG